MVIMNYEHNDFAGVVKQFCNFQRKGSGVKYCLGLLPRECTHLLCTQNCVTRAPHRLERCTHTMFFSVLLLYSCIHHTNAGVHVPFYCMIKRELYCFMSQNALWQLYLLINLLKLASSVCGKRFKSCISSIWISS